MTNLGAYDIQHWKPLKWSWARILQLHCAIAATAIVVAEGESHELAHVEKNFSKQERYEEILKQITCGTS